MNDANYLKVLFIHNLRLLCYILCLITCKSNTDKSIEKGEYRSQMLFLFILMIKPTNQ